MLQKLKNKPIIINLDLDGLLCGLLLQKYLNCNIVGFSNSVETIWLQKNFTAFNSVCFIDLFVANKNTICLDQHIVSVHHKHHQILSKNNCKINPNLMLERTFLPIKSYAMKYPFGTIHFLIALLEAERIPMQLELDKEIKNISLINLILRADDCMKTTVNSNYEENAKQWWSWLQKLSKNKKTTNKLVKYVSALKPKEVAIIKNKIKTTLTSKPFNCKTSDGGIEDILEKNGTLKNNVWTYFTYLSKFIEEDITHWNQVYKTYNGIAKRTSLNKEQQNELIDASTLNGKTIFSYAFVKSDKKQDNFSYTLFKTK